MCEYVCMQMFGRVFLCGEEGGREAESEREKWKKKT
jgi:hypothetical protein